jgi:hypothetical protein
VIRTLPFASEVAVSQHRALDIDPVELNEPVTGSYSSAGAKVASEPSVPPVISTLPLASNVAVCPARALDIDPVELNEPVAGSYSSADARMVKLPATKPLPPVIRTLPLGSKVAVWFIRALDMGPVGLNEPVSGSYSSADARKLTMISPSLPPVIRTLPLGSKVAVCPTRALDIDPVELNEPLPGSYNSADVKPQPSWPPAIRTLPLASKVAVPQHRALDIDPVKLNEPWGAKVGIAVGVAVGIALRIAVGVAVGVVVAVAVGL